MIEDCEVKALIRKYKIKIEKIQSLPYVDDLTFNMLDSVIAAYKIYITELTDLMKKK